MAWLGVTLPVLKSKGIEVVLLATPRMAQLVDELGQHVGGGRMRLANDEKKPSRRANSMQFMFIDGKAVDDLVTDMTWGKLSKKKAGRVVSAAAEIRYRSGQEELIAENVLAFIEGTDKKDEIIVLTAHYDHIGVENGVVYNGADDDGTGTVAMIEIAEAFALAKAQGHGPRRSVLVMPVSGEEKGLLGSRYYSEHPVFPLENTVADLNIDMIGRVDSAHADSDPYIYVIGSDRLSSELHAVNERANSMGPDLVLDYTFNAPDDPNRFYYRSDHYNFARKGVPSIFYFSGVHEDYHQPGDDVEKIMFDLLVQRTHLVFHTAWILANQEDRIAVDKVSEP
ncbi:MAG: M28 family peptidase [Flavobacteriales bacterium]|nr:M28 family peptidase [Flavobacteriales bacterium]